MPIIRTTYLNQTPNKTPRGLANFTPELGIMHETAGYGSLTYNLRRDVASSFNYWIGTEPGPGKEAPIEWYVDEQKFIAWGAGIGPPGAVGGVLYDGYSRWTTPRREYWRRRVAGLMISEINECAINIEIEGLNNGNPITPAQRDAAIWLLRHLSRKYAIPLIAAYWPEHMQVAPIHKSDAQGYSAAYLVQLAAAPSTAPANGVDPRLAAIWAAAGGKGHDDSTLGMWIPGPGLGLGLAIQAPDGNGIIQKCERMYIGQGANGQARFPRIDELKAWGLL